MNPLLKAVIVASVATIVSSIVVEWIKANYDLGPKST